MHPCPSHANGKHANLPVGRDEHPSPQASCGRLPVPNGRRGRDAKRRTQHFVSSGTTLSPTAPPHRHASQKQRGRVLIKGQGGHGSKRRGDNTRCCSDVPWKLGYQPYYPPPLREQRAVALFGAYSTASRKRCGRPGRSAPLMGKATVHHRHGRTQRNGGGVVGKHQKGSDLSGGPRGGWRRLPKRFLSVTNAVEAGTWRQGDNGWA